MNHNDQLTVSTSSRSNWIGSYVMLNPPPLWREIGRALAYAFRILFRRLWWHVRHLRLRPKMHRVVSHSATTITVDRPL